jgi:hypothetical protein
VEEDAKMQNEKNDETLARPCNTAAHYTPEKRRFSSLLGVFDGDGDPLSRDTAATTVNLKYDAGNRPKVASVGGPN